MEEQQELSPAAILYVHLAQGEIDLVDLCLSADQGDITWNQAQTILGMIPEEGDEE